MKRVTRKVAVHVVYGGASTRKRGEPHGRNQVAIYLRPESGENRRGVGKTRGRNMINRLATIYRRVVSAAREWTFSMLMRWRGGYPRMNPKKGRYGRALYCVLDVSA